MRGGCAVNPADGRWRRYSGWGIPDRADACPDRRRFCGVRVADRLRLYARSGEGSKGAGKGNCVVEHAFREEVGCQVFH